MEKLKDRAGLDTKAEMHIRQPLRDAEQLEKALSKNPSGTMEMVANVHAENAEAWKESDREMIHAAVERSVGFESLNSLVKVRILLCLKTMLLAFNMRIIFFRSRGVSWISLHSRSIHPTHCFSKLDKTWLPSFPKRRAS